jgi:hypothetical protein
VRENCRSSDAGCTRAKCTERVAIFRTIKLLILRSGLLIVFMAIAQIQVQREALSVQGYPGLDI